MSQNLPLTSELHFNKISEDVYTFVPTEGTHPNGNLPTAWAQPKLIIIFGWMEGKIWTLKKYMSIYNTMYPHATQLLILSRSSSAYSSDRRNAQLLAPAVDFLNTSALFVDGAPPNTLIHVFSNGGGFQLLRLSEILTGLGAGNNSVAGDSHPVAAMVFDSVPGDAGLGPALVAHTAWIRPFFFKVLAVVPLSLLYFAVLGSNWLMGKPSPYTSLRDGLKAPDVFPGMEKSTPRTYIYSQEDRIVQAEAVERHIAELRVQGFNVSVEQFKGSQHVAHVKKDPGRYWDNRREDLGTGSGT
ncbi:hypothetical protein C8R44DRAFT_975410 [Mycena epipterygia]|nr:hypothetical protein C8R44DRAFT_975410 [Mycena epipterygia]